MRLWDFVLRLIVMIMWRGRPRPRGQHSGPSARSITAMFAANAVEETE